MKKVETGQPVFSVLSHRLIVLYTVSTGLILAVTLCLTWLYNEGQARLHSRENFLQLFSTLENEVRSSNQISHSRLGSLEREYRCNIHIEDNGNPITFHNVYPLSTELSPLLNMLRETALDLNIRTDRYPLTTGSSNSGLLTLHGIHGDSYLAGICQLTDGPDWQNVYLIQEVTRSPRDLMLSVSFFLLLFLAGLFLLFLLSRYLIRRTLLPVRESIRKQKEFIAAASHELRSPLAVLRVNLSALKSALLPDGKEHSEILTDMEAELTRITSLTDDMLLLASLDASGSAGWRAELVPLEPDAFLIDLYEDFFQAAAKADMKLELMLPEDPLPPCLADPERLRQLFAILFDNAFCYACSGKSLILAAGESGGSVRIALADHGPGIPEEKRSTIFERFSRGDSSRSEKKHYGLGLSIAAELAALHHGRLTLEETPGGGCTFVLQLSTCKGSAHQGP